MDKKGFFYWGVLLSVIISFLYIFISNVIHKPWVDEIGTVDSAANYVLTGNWYSHVWEYTYNPLHNFILVLWLKIWGISHVSVCALSVFLSFVSYVVLLRILIIRNIIKKLEGTLLFTVLFWGGWVFSELFVQGRIDMLVLLLSILTVDSVLPLEGRDVYKNKISVAASSFLLMFSSVYAIPVLIVFFIGLYFIVDDKQSLLKKYVIVFSAWFVSFLFVCVFFLYNHRLVKFLYSLTSFSATLSGSNSGKDPFFDRLINAYTIDYSALALLLVSVIVLLLIHKRINHVIFYYLFVLAIPLIMVVAGRYQMYYSWLFYIPVIILFVYSISQIENKKIRYAVLFVIFLFYLIGKPIALYRQNVRHVIIENSANTFLQNLPLNHNDKVLFFDENFYYPLITIGAERWYKYGGLKDWSSPKDRLVNLLNNKIKNEEKRNKYIDWLLKIEHFSEGLPDRGYLIIDINTKRYSVDFMINHGFGVDDVYEDGKNAAIRFYKETE